MSRVISVANEKGGVGKTITARMLASIYAEQGKNVLVIDFDPQASLTSGYGLDPNIFSGTSPHNICHMFEKREITLLEVEDNGHKVYLIPANGELGTISQGGKVGKELVLRRYIKQNDFDDIFDIIIIDTNPKFDAMTISALLASDIIAVPVETAKEAQEGLQGFIEKTEEALDVYERSIENFVIIPNKHRENTNVSKLYLGIITKDTLPYIKENLSILSKSNLSVTDPLLDMTGFKEASSYNVSAYVYFKKFAKKTIKKENKEKALKQMEAIAEKLITYKVG